MTASTHTRQESWVVLAPHLRLPPVNGADVLIMGRWAAMSVYLRETYIVAEDRILCFSAGEMQSIQTFSNRNRSKVTAALRTMVAGTHYYYEKFLTEQYERAADELLSSLSSPVVVASYPAVGVWASKRYPQLCVGPQRRLYVETHNDEFKWFRDIERSATNFLTRRVAASSGSWLRRTLPSLLQQAALLHVSDSDRRGYEAEVGTHSSLVAPVGVESPPSGLSKNRRRDDMIKLVFIGSLSVSMNFDALCIFAEKFEPGLRAELGQKLQVVIVGSNPSRVVTQLCRRHGWTLRANASDRELTDELMAADFALMPFERMNGGKLKLVKALAYGTPILGTSLVRNQVGDELPRCVFSDQVSDWVDACRAQLHSRTTEAQASCLQSVARRFSWTALAADLIAGVERIGSVDRERRSDSSEG